MNIGQLIKATQGVSRELKTEFWPQRLNIRRYLSRSFGPKVENQERKCRTPPEARLRDVERTDRPTARPPDRPTARSFE
jgi:hypothetical protein